MAWAHPYVTPHNGEECQDHIIVWRSNPWKHGYWLRVHLIGLSTTQAHAAYQAAAPLLVTRTLRAQLPVRKLLHRDASCDMGVNIKCISHPVAGY
jgi:hypothetical protein